MMLGLLLRLIGGGKSPSPRPQLRCGLLQDRLSNAGLHGYTLRLTLQGKAILLTPARQRIGVVSALALEDEEVAMRVILSWIHLHVNGVVA